MPNACPFDLAAASHLALGAGVDVASAVLYTSQAAAVDLTINSPTILFALLAATGVYLLDRVKLRDAWLDPADQQAHPARFRFLASRSALIRTLIAALLTAACVIGYRIHPLLLIGVIAACIGVLAYAGRPRTLRPRIKDILLLKNCFVALGIAAFAAALALITSQPNSRPADWLAQARDHAPALLFAFATLAIRVFADAALCDLDDESSDRAYGTATLPTHLGRRHAWNIAMALRLALGAALILWPSPATRAWGLITITTTLALRALNPPRVRDLVDARFGLEALLATLVH